jgi:hypothetical protein
LIGKRDGQTGIVFSETGIFDSGVAITSSCDVLTMANWRDPLMHYTGVSLIF